MSGDPNSSSPASILVVDDTPANLRLLHQILRHEGHGVRVATSGALALRSVQEDPPDLVLLDIRMPGMDGFAVCQELKANTVTRDIPIIFLSALSETEHKLEAFAAGGADYITKPFEAAEVVARVRTHLELQRHRRALTELNEKLQRSNSELEQFAHVASHDLQEPLRMMASFSSLLASRYRGKLDQSADEYIAYILDGAERMSTLIKDLLALSRVGTQGQPFEPIPCADVVADACRDLGPAIEESGAELVVGELPVVMADRTQLRQVFQNLVANAIKFRGAQPPRVELRAERVSEGWEISVTDNGIGIAPEDHDRIFGIFERLHTRTEYPGSGIGLSLVKKIVERHGGRIRLDSTPGESSTFRFTLPRSE